MRASAAAAGRINHAGRVRPRQHGWLACGSGSDGLAYGSAWVGLACGSHALLGQFTSFAFNFGLICQIHPRKPWTTSPKPQALQASR